MNKSLRTLFFGFMVNGVLLAYLYSLAGWPALIAGFVLILSNYLDGITRHRN